ncbi:hypothetical protein BC833DRAFT_581703 [Globomyces pollinis-pini]|nr:hypothetical protein BC833DRAFT_581703 [Globomyces pollinis-pini]
MSQRNSYQQNLPNIPSTKLDMDPSYSNGVFIGYAQNSTAPMNPNQRPPVHAKPQTFNTGNQYNQARPGFNNPPAPHVLPPRPIQFNQAPPNPEFFNQNQRTSPGSPNRQSPQLSYQQFASPRMNSPPPNPAPNPPRLDTSDRPPVEDDDDDTPLQQLPASFIKMKMNSTSPTVHPIYQPSYIYPQASAPGSPAVSPAATPQSNPPPSSSNNASKGLYRANSINVQAAPLPPQLNTYPPQSPVSPTLKSPALSFEAVERLDTAPINDGRNVNRNSYQSNGYPQNPYANANKQQNVPQQQYQNVPQQQYQNVPQQQYQNVPQQQYQNVPQQQYKNVPQQQYPPQAAPYQRPPQGYPNQQYLPPQGHNNQQQLPPQGYANQFRPPAGQQPPMVRPPQTYQNQGSPIMSGANTPQAQNAQRNEQPSQQHPSPNQLLSPDDAEDKLLVRPTFKTISRKSRYPENQPQKIVPVEETISQLRQKAQATKDQKDQFELAKLCITTGGSYSDEGFSLLKKLATSGYPEANYFLGQAYADDGKDSNAYSQFVIAAKKGFAPACFAIGSCSEVGRGCKKNIRLATDMYLKAATAGNLDAMYRLGQAEMRGELGLHPDIVKATKWFKRAAAVPDKEHPEPLFELAKIYETGVPPYVSADPAYARGVLKEASDLGYPPAMYKLGYCHEHGLLGVTPNAEESIRLYTLAVQSGNADAQLGMAGWHMTGADKLLSKNEQLAFDFAQKSAQQNLARAQYTLAYFYETGIGCQRNLDEALKYYKLAAAQGEARARERLTRGDLKDNEPVKPAKKKGWFSRK